MTKANRNLVLFCKVIAEHLSLEEVAGIRETFETIDTRKRGRINLEELRDGLQKLGQQVHDDDLQTLMEAVSCWIHTFYIFDLTEWFWTAEHVIIDLQADVDGDGALNYGEFVAVSIHLKKMDSDEHLHKAFAFLDKNGSGYIEMEELRSALIAEVDSNSEDVIVSIMHDVDTDKVSDTQNAATAIASEL